MNGFTTRPELQGTFGMVASTHWLASATGMAMLERGGNAADAAVAAGLVLQVVEPHLNGPGGEAPVILWSAPLQRALVINGQGPAPAAATISRFAALGLDAVPGTGLLAACVPAAFDSWMLLLRDHGSMPLHEVMAPAIDYAEKGHPLLPRVAATIAEMEPTFRDEWPESAEVWLPGGLPRPGELFRNPRLAGTYRRIDELARAAGDDRDAQIEAARDAFLRGFIAEAVDSFVRRAERLDSSGRRHSGLLTAADMAAFRATDEAPARLPYRDVEVCKTGPWGQGPVMLQQLALLEGFALRDMERGGVEHVHTVMECAKLAFADREAWYGDPAFVDVPLDDLLSPAYSAERRALVTEQASLELRCGRPGGRTPVLPHLPTGAAEHAGTGDPTLERAQGDTCHVDVVDRHGTLISATPSGGWLQGSPAIPGLGFCLGTRAQMLWLTEGVPNALAPNKRPRTTLTPSLALRDGRGWLAWGTPGGDMQDQWALTVLLDHLDFGLDLQAAIDAPAFHTTHFPSSFHPHQAHPGEVVVEERLGAATVDGLRRRGHRVVVAGPWSLGRVSAVSRGHDGVLRAAANPRGMQGYAAGR